ncbi:MAG: DUF4178 domain-containing protein [Candidatus Omnitrophica bacterium]|nr:DUF4178 domain-containing protein [Candidatus Omnitrophota bacterium]
MAIKSLEDLSKGDCLRYHQTDWLVTDQYVYSHTGTYQETQWTLESKGKQTVYLVKQEEKKGSDTEIVWILTHEIELGSIRYPGPQGEWVSFKEKETPPSPPESIKLNDGTSFTLRNKTSGRARDDDGKMVPKLTWDYYDSSGKRNIAIEIWEESDGNYPDAYDGTVVDLSDIRILPPDDVKKVRRRIRPVNKNLSNVYVFVGIGAFIMMSSGFAIEWLIAASIPIASIIIMFLYGSLFWQIAFSATWIIFSLVLFFIFNMAAPFWTVLTILIILSVLILKMIPYFSSDIREKVTPLIFFAVFLPGSWIYSFYMYFRFAPGPHNFIQFMETCLLPIFITGVLFGVNKLLDQYDQQT